MKQPKASKHSKKAWAAKPLLCLVFIVNLLLLPLPAHAKDNINIVYDVYAGGMNVVEAKLNINLTKPDHYSLTLDAYTRGFLARLAPWEGIFESYGWHTNNMTYWPKTHKSTGIWRGEKETKEYSYNKDRSFKSLIIKDHDKPAHTRKMDKELTNKTIDVLTATMRTMQKIAHDGQCENTSEVFDGKRRFRLNFNHETTDTLEPSRYNVYGGQAARCTVEVEPIAGAWHKKPRGWMSIQEQGREKGTMPTVWFAQIEKNAPAVPVKILVKTAYGALVMHLVEYKNGQTALISEKRKDIEE